MPFTATYANYYAMGSSAPNAGTTVPNVAATTGGTTISDTGDASDDGFLAVNAAVQWSAGPGMQYFGQTDAGDPILYDTGIGQYYLLSNTANLQNSSQGFQSTTYTMCFAEGTGITTAKGEVAVETLAPGDLVQTADGRLVPVKWIGRQVVNKMFARNRAQPVCIQSGALGNGLPERDLVVTADHGMVLDDLVINASALVNGSTIVFVSLDDLALCETYYHIETEAHDVILANGTASETYMDTPGRQGFANYQEYLDLYGPEVSVPEMARPRIASQRMLPDALRARLGISDIAIQLTA